MKRNSDDYNSAKCKGKHRFESYSMCKKVFNLRKGNRHSNSMYKCTICKFWHIGTHIKSKKPIKRIIIEDE